MVNHSPDKIFRVMMVEPLGDGGIAHYAFNLVQALLAAGHSPILFTSKRYELEDRSWPPNSLIQGFFRLAFSLIRIIPALDKETGISNLIRRILKVLEYPFNALEAVIIAHRNDIRIVHIQTVNFVDLIFILVSRLGGLKVVTTIHNVNPLHRKMKKIHIPLYKAMYGLSNHLIIHTQAGSEEIQHLFGIPENKISVIPHGDYTFFVPESGGNPLEARRKLDLPSTPPVMLFFGAIRPNKGLDIILKAMSHVIETIPDSMLLIAGEPGEDFPRYEELIQDLGISASVRTDLHYISISEVPNYFAASDLVVLPYLEITQSGVLQVAMAFGKPVIASDLPGFREIISHGKTGWLVSPNDEDALALGCISILSGELDGHKIGKAGRNFVEKEFSWKKIGHRTVGEVYNLLV